MTAQQFPQPVPPPRPAAVSRLLVGLAFILFLIDAIVTATGHTGDWEWLLPGGLAALALAFVVPVW